MHVVSVPSTFVCVCTHMCKIFCRIQNKLNSEGKGFLGCGKIVHFTWRLSLESVLEHRGAFDLQGQAIFFLDCLTLQMKALPSFEMLGAAGLVTASLRIRLESSSSRLSELQITHHFACVGGWLPTLFLRRILRHLGCESWLFNMICYLKVSNVKHCIVGCCVRYIWYVQHFESLLFCCHHVRVILFVLWFILSHRV